MISNGRPYTNENGVSDSGLIYTLPDSDIVLISDWIKENIRSACNNVHRYNSYGLKHMLQHDTNVYVTNNQFKHAMLLAGYVPVDPDELNWEFDIVLVRDIIENPSPFFNWLKRYTDEDSMIGDFARDAAADRDFPAMADYWVIRRYLERRHICYDCLCCFEMAWKRWRRFKKKNAENVENIDLRTKAKL